MTERAGILAGLRVIEVSAFVAAPLAGATLAELGADVIRVDPLGGGVDIARWPLYNGRSLYWAGLNQGKRSLTLNLRSERGRGLLTQLIARHVDGIADGILLTNLGVPDWMAYERLVDVRPDLIMLVITGNPDGSTAVDYTVNAALGFPYVTGPETFDGPVNHVLPAWDALTGYLSATALLAAERQRRLTGEGQQIALSLADVGLSVTGHLGYLAEAALVPQPRPRSGNDLYGTFGRDFASRDGRRLMVSALTPRQWTSLCDATGTAQVMAALEQRLGLDFRHEGDRYAARRQICALLEPWFAEHGQAEIQAIFDRAGVLWGPYQTFKELVASDPRCSTANPIVAEVEQPDIGTVPAVGSPLRYSGQPGPGPAPAPRLGQHTGEVLCELAGVRPEDLPGLRAEGVIG